MPLPALLLLAALPSTPPFPVDKKPLPKGADWSTLLPAQLGPYRRTSLKPPTPQTDGEANYTGNGHAFFLLFGKAPNDRELAATFATIEHESRSAPDQPLEREQVSLAGPTRFLLRVEKRGTFFAWTRGLHYCSVETKSDKAALKAFLDRFPW